MRLPRTLSLFLLAFLATAMGCASGTSVAQPVPDEGFIEINGARIHYQAEGSGPAMMLIHGYPLNGDLFRAQRAALSDEYRVITPTLHGYGESEARSGREGRIETYASDMLAVMDELGVDEALIGGMSMGGPIVFEMYRQAPDRFRGMLLIDTTPKPAIPAEAGLWRGVANQVQQEGVASLVPFLIKDMLTGDTRMNDPALVQDLSAMIEAASRQGALSGAQALRTRPDSRPTLGRITVPTLILTGVEDSLYPYETAKMMDDRISNSTLVMPSGVAHAAIIEAPDRSTEAIRAWANGLQ